MSALAISFGTEAWLAALVEAGYELTVSENRAPAHRITLQVCEDDPLELEAPERVSVGVLARKDEVGAFVPCASESEARNLVERVLAEAWE